MNYNNFEKYKRDGFVVYKFFNKKENKLICNFAVNWFYKLCEIRAEDIYKFPISKYHLWYKKKSIDHEKICDAKKRYVYPPLRIQRIIKKNKKIRLFLNKLGIKKFKMWDDGWGWIGFRLIRPNCNDGYPLSKKAWGKASNVVSCWFPVIGKSKNDTLTLVPKSNLQTYETYLPKNTKFTKDEPRLKKIIKLELFNPKIKNNELIIFSPETLHSESNKNLKKTRFNLEFRFNPSN